MSDRDDVSGNSGYSTPVPELDDHRHQSPSVQRPDRSRRGTFDSLYGARQLTHTSNNGESLQESRTRDFEEAIADEDHPGLDSPPTTHSRRPTVESMFSDQVRSLSPPNSVKAFAEARRRERTLSFSEGKPDRKGDDLELQRTVSGASRRTFNKPLAVVDDAASLKSNKTAEDDVCFPLQDDRRDNNLHIDFGFLESFVKSDSEARKAARRPSANNIFSDLRPETAKAERPPPMITADGDILELPGQWETQEEKPEDTDKEDVERHKRMDPVQHQQATDHSRVSFFSTSWESTIHAADLEGLTLPGENIRGLFSFPKGESDGVWWLNINNPSEEETRAVCRAFGIHPLTIEDITTQEAREKIELFPSYYFACFRSFYMGLDGETGEQEYKPFNMYVVVFREGTLSFSYAHNAHSSHVRKRITMLKDYVSLSSDWICYALIDDIVDSFAPVISQIERESDQIEDAVFIARPGDMQDFLRRIGTARKNVTGLMRLLGGKADVLRGFTKRCNENYKVTPRMDIGLYLGDIQDHVVTMMTNLGHFEKMLSRAHSNYLAQMSIDNISQGTMTNRVLGKITLIASLIVPLNVITGLFGMNVPVPFGEPGNLVPFFTILASLVCFMLLSWFLVKKTRVLDSM